MKAYALSNAADARSLYNEWAASYDKDLKYEQYAFPQRAVEALEGSLGRGGSIKFLKLLDAGCGTGLVGAVLAQQGAKYIDGVDISPGMLDVARKRGVYTSLEEADLASTIPKPDESYDVVICVGTLTEGHVGPSALDEFSRIVRKGGFIVATITDAVWKRLASKTRLNIFAAQVK